jgi:hypothetical protein
MDMREQERLLRETVDAPLFRGNVGRYRLEGQVPEPAPYS